jgi:hypothetical protein
MFVPGWLSTGELRKFDVGDLPGGSAWDGDIADIDLDGGTDIGAALAGTDLILVDDGANGTMRKCAVSRVLTYVRMPLSATTTVTTANVTAAVNTRYELDISGLTAARSFVLPAGAVGDRIEVLLTVGDATYELNIIGDTGISINSRAAATLFTCLVVAGEHLAFVATSTSNWALVADGRQSLAWRTSNNTSTEQLIDAQTLTTLSTAFSAWGYGVSQWYSSGVFTPKRPGKWLFGVAITFVPQSGSWAIGNSLSGAIYRNDEVAGAFSLGNSYAVTVSASSLSLVPCGTMNLNGSTDNARVKVYLSTAAKNTLTERAVNFWGVWLGDT